MLGLPKSTEFNKRIPKQKFYENLQISPALKRNFVDQIKVIYWKNKIAASTVNLASGKIVTEIEVFEIHLNGKELDEAVLKQIDREIPYHILFLLEYEGKVQARIGYKESVLSGNTAFKVNRYFQTDWMAEEDLPLKMEGLDLDAVYENFVRQTAGDELRQTEENENLKTSIERDEEIKKLKKEIEKLQTKLKREKQLNRQIEINAQIKSLKKKLEEKQ